MLGCELSYSAALKGFHLMEEAWFKTSFHYIMEICKEEDALFRKPRRKLSLFSQRAQFHNIMSQWLESTVAAMQNVQAALPSHPTERHQVLQEQY